MHLDWKAAFNFHAEDADWKKKVLTGGLWLLLFPPLGWPIALGYRKAVIIGLIESPNFQLPDWKLNTWTFFIDGLRAVGVILVYFLPFIFLFWTLGVDDWSILKEHIPELLIFALSMVFLIPICLPLLPPIYWLLFPWIQLTPFEMVVVGVVFWSTTFVMPAAFLQVSLTGRFRAAFRLWRVLRIVATNFRNYIEAWCISLAATVIALASGLFAPWGLFWSYLVIVYTFNEALFLSDSTEVRERYQSSHFSTRRQNGD